MLHHIIRVELHGAISEDYRNLERMLRAIGVTDEVDTSTGREILPSGEYHIVSSSTTQQVHDAVKTIADRTGRNNSIVVTSAPGSNIFVSGLRPARDRDLGR